MKYKTMIHDYRNFIARLHSEGVIAPGKILLALFEDYVNRLPQAGAFFTLNNARADEVFAKSIIEQLQKILTESTLRQLLRTIDNELSCRQQYKHYDVHTEFHTLWIAFFTYYPYLFSIKDVDLALEDNPLNPALLYREARSQFSSFLKNSCMKARLIQAEIANRDLECIFTTVRELAIEARKSLNKSVNLDGYDDLETSLQSEEFSPELHREFLGYGNKDSLKDYNANKLLSAFARLVSQLSPNSRASAFNTLVTMTYHCDVFTYHFNYEAMLLVIASLSAEQRKVAFNTLTGIINNDPMNIRPLIILNLLALQTNLSEQELNIGFTNLKNLLSETRPVILNELQFYDMTLAKHFTRIEYECIYTRLLSLFQDAGAKLNKFERAGQLCLRRMLRNLTAYCPADFHAEIMAFWTTFSPKYAADYHHANVMLITLAPQLTGELRKAMLQALIAPALNRMEYTTDIQNIIAMVTELAVDDPLIAITHLINLIINCFKEFGSYQRQHHIALEQIEVISLSLTLALQKIVLNWLVEFSKKPITEGGYDATRCLTKLLLALNNPALALETLARLSELKISDTGQASLITKAIVALSTQLSDNQFAEAFKILMTMARGNEDVAFSAIASMTELCPRLSQEQFDYTLECVWSIADLDQSNIDGESVLAPLIAQLSPRLLLDDLNRAFKILWSLAIIVRNNYSEVFIRAEAALAIATLSIHCPHYLDKTLEILKTMIDP
ncbi:MAG: hypothetical protein M3R00_08850, partial [Pseudomonadota bacterium]|nr:hypothetical protein [Pseudomonadota bacterium]